ncbi:MAG: DUF3572 family protein [Hyphomicrobium sp.]
MSRLKRQKLSTLKRDDAEIIALKGLTFLAEDPRRLQRFMSLTGIDIQELAETAGNIPCLVAALEYLRNDESLLLMFASNHALSVKVIANARDTLERMSLSEPDESEPEE